MHDKSICTNVNSVMRYSTRGPKLNFQCFNFYIVGFLVRDDSNGVLLVPIQYRIAKLRLFIVFAWIKNFLGVRNLKKKKDMLQNIDGCS